MYAYNFNLFSSVNFTKDQLDQLDMLFSSFAYHALSEHLGIDKNKIHIDCYSCGIVPFEEDVE